MSEVEQFTAAAKGLSKNPLGIIALFIVLVYAIAGLALGLSLNHLNSGERQPLIWFLVLFPVLVLFAFGWLVSQHHTKLYSPTDFRDELIFLKLDEKIRTEIDDVRRLTKALYWYDRGEKFRDRRLWVLAKENYENAKEIHGQLTIAYTALANVLREEAKDESTSELRISLLSQAIDYCNTAETIENKYEDKSKRNLGDIFLLRAAIQFEKILLLNKEKSLNELPLEEVQRDVTNALSEDKSLLNSLTADPTLSKLHVLPWYVTTLRKYGVQANELLQRVGNAGS